MNNVCYTAIKHKDYQNKPIYKKPVPKRRTCCKLSDEMRIFSTIDGVLAGIRSIYTLKMVALHT